MLAKKGRKLLSLLLAFSMCVSIAGISVSAAEIGTNGSGELICNQTEHAHSGECYQQVLTCTQSESEGHTHSDACYDEAGELICGQAESEGHVHSAECYEQVLTCTQTEHTHTAACYAAADPEPGDSTEPADPESTAPADPEPTETADPEPGDYIAQIGGDTYGTLQEAINAAPEGEIVTLAANTAEDITISRSITLNLNGWTLTGTPADAPVVTVAEGAAVTIQDGTITGKDSRKIEGLITAANADLTLNNCVVTGNQAGKNGSAIIRAEGGSLTITGGEVTSCTQKNGGSIVLANNCALAIDGVRFSGNSAAKGVISLQGTASLDMDGCSFNGDASTSSKTGILYVQSSGSVSVTDTTFTGGTANSIPLYMASTAAADTPATLELTNVTMSGYTSSNYTVYVAGAVNVTAQELTLENNVTTAGGSILSLSNTGTNTLTGCTVTGNQAKTGASGGSTITVGASAKTTFTSCTVTNNTSGSSSSGINVAKNGSVELNNCLISGNRVDNTNASAGGLYLGDNATATVTDTVIKNNRRANLNNYAGGVYAGTGSTFTMTGGALYGNVNENGGNANDLYATNATITLPEADQMADEEVSFAGYKWLNNGVPLNAAPDRTKKSYNLTAKIYSTENVQIIRDGVALEGFYNTLNDAFAAAAAGDTLKLVAPSGEVNMTQNVTLGRDQTIDMNGCAISGGKTLTLNKGATLTFQGDGEFQGSVVVGATSTRYGHLVLDGNVAFSEAVKAYGQKSTPSTVTVRAPMDAFALSVYKYTTVTVEAGAPIGTLDLTLGVTGSYPYDVTAEINAPVDTLNLSQFANKGNSGVEYSVATLNSTVGTLNLAHYGSSLGTDNTDPYSQVIAGADFSAGSLTYTATYLTKTVAQKYSTAGSEGLPDIVFLTGAGASNVDLAQATWTATNGYLGTDKDLTTIQLDDDGNLVLRYAPYSGDVYLSGSGSDENSGMVPSASVQTLDKALELLKAAGEDAAIVVTGTVTVDEAIDLSNVTFERYPTLKNALFDIQAEVTLTNVTVDGCGVSAQEPLIDVASGGTLNIGEGTVLTGGVNTGSINGSSMGSSRGEGGAIRTAGTVNMTADSTITGNSAYAGGGVLVLSGGELNLSGGQITDNHATGEGSTLSPSGGGGVLVARSGSMTMSGGSVSNNTSADVGGGITLGGGESSAYIDTISHPTLNMTGGIISGNTSAKEGGGLHVQITGVATISAGQITGNESEGGSYFSGGGVYVNGGHHIFGSDYANGQLNLTNVWISDNTASAGGGIAGCPTASVKIYLNDGGVIWGNHDEASAADDIRMVSSIMGWPANGNEEVYISRYMLGNGLYQWTNKEDNTPATSRQLLGKESHLYSAAQEADLTANASDCTVIITGNTGALLGGGIGTNGDVTIGVSDPDLKLGQITVEKDWQDIEGVDMSEDVYKKVFNVTFDLYYREKGSEDSWTLMDTKTSTVEIGYNSWSDVVFTDLLMEDEQGVEYEYEVVERADDRYEQVGEPVISDDGLTWTFTNRPVYSLKVAKAVVDSYGVAQGEKFTFHITLSDVADVTAVDQDGNPVTLNFVDGTATVELAGGEYVILSGLKHDTTYTVTEDAHPDYTQTITLETWKNSSSYEKETVNSVQDQALVLGLNTVTFTNTTKEPVGSLAIRKTVTGDGAADALWHFTVELFQDEALTQPMPQQATGKPAYAFAYTVTNANGTQASTGIATVTSEGKLAFGADATIALTSGQTVTITGIPAGVFFRINEQEANANGYTTTVTLNGAALSGVTAVGSITKDETQLAAYTNDLPSNPPIIPPDPTPDPDPDPTPDPDPDPSDPPVEIPDDDVPQGELPEQPGDPGTQPENPGETVIDEEEPPLADAPETGDSLPLWITAAALSGLGLAALAITGRKRKEEN